MLHMVQNPHRRSGWLARRGTSSSGESCLHVDNYAPYLHDHGDVALHKGTRESMVCQEVFDFDQDSISSCSQENEHFLDTTRSSCSIHCVDINCEDVNSSVKINNFAQTNNFTETLSNPALVSDMESTNFDNGFSQVIELGNEEYVEILMQRKEFAGTRVGYKSMVSPQVVALGRRNH